MAPIKVKSLPAPPDWRAAEKLTTDNAEPEAVLKALLRLPVDADHFAVAAALSAVPDPTISIYAQGFTAHVTAARGLSEGQVYTELRDYCAAHAADDPAMRAVKRAKMLELLDKWQAEGPPSAGDDRVWREFDADLARARGAGPSPDAEDLIARAEHAEALNRELNDKIRALEAEAERLQAEAPGQR